jgi:hypothetical protein
MLALSRGCAARASARIIASTVDQIDVNVRCLEGVDAEALPIARFDGRSWD